MNWTYTPRLLSLFALIAFVITLFAVMMGTIPLFPLGTILLLLALATL